MINFVTWQSEFDTFDIIWDRDKSIRCVGLRVGEYMSFQNHKTLTLNDAFDAAEEVLAILKEYVNDEETTPSQETKHLC
mgnify:CR=1 FL=1|jgi:hypothetical protein